MFDNVTKTESRWRNLWPQLDDLETARSASRQGMWAAAIVAVLTALFAAFGVLGTNASAFFDAVLFAVIGIGIYRISRVAAVAGLLLFILERAVIFAQTRQTGGVVAIFILLAFGNGARGAFAYRRLLKASAAAPSNPAEA